jgi:hypothetical protein
MVIKTEKISPETHPITLPYDPRMDMWMYEVEEGYTTLTPALMLRKLEEESQLLPAVPQTVHQRMVVIRDLMCCAHYNYEFLSIEVKPTTILLEHGLQERSNKLARRPATCIPKRKIAGIDYKLSWLIGWKDLKSLMKFHALVNHNVRAYSILYYRVPWSLFAW